MTLNQDKNNGLDFACLAYPRCDMWAGLKQRCAWSNFLSKIDVRETYKTLS